MTVLTIGPINIYLTMTHKLVSSSIHQFSFPRDWDNIREICKGNSGVYALVNNINGNAYIGSGVDLYSRLRDYHQPWYLASRTNLVIVRAINKYGMENFTLVVLEFTTPELAVPSEQIWIDSHSPEYNTSPTASSSLGVKHTEQGKIKIREGMTGKARSQDVREAMSQRQTGSGNTFFGMSHTDESKALLREAALARIFLPKAGYAVTVVDTLTNNKSQSYKSLREASLALKCSRRSLTINNGKLFRGRYLITFNGDGTI
jgi:group I intron endonuclease